MRKKGLFLLILLGTVLMVTHPLQARESSNIQKDSFCESFGIQRPSVRKEAPSFSLKDLNGKWISLNQYRGRPLLLFFWGSWCQACKEEMLLLEKFFERNRGQIEILTIAIDGEKERRIRNLIKSQQIALSILLDRKERVARAYGVKMIPTTFLISGEGVVEGIIVGQREWDRPIAFSAVKELFDLR